MESAALLQQENTSAAAPGGGASTNGSASTSAISKPERICSMTPLTASTLPRKRLSDITNLASDNRVVEAKAKENAGASVSSAAYIAQLLKENNALMRALGERNKVIELSASEVQNLRFALQKVTLQNQQLAQANSQLLVERTNDKDRLKAFQHEMGCREAVIKVKNLELKEKKKLIKELRAMRGGEHNMLGQTESDYVAGGSRIPVSQNACDSIRKRTRSQSLGPAVMNRQVAAKEKDESSRSALRRRSTRLSNGLSELHEAECEVEDVTTPMLARNTSMNKDIKSRGKSLNPIPLTCKVKEEVVESAPFGTPQVQHPEERRSSIVRPMRRAAEKVSSYKEVPLNIKMRRPEVWQQCTKLPAFKRQRGNPREVHVERKRFRISETGVLSRMEEFNGRRIFSMDLESWKDN